MPDFRVYYISDGESVAKSIAQMFSKDRFNVQVELHDLQRRRRVSNRSSGSSSVSSGEFCLQPSFVCENDVTDIAVLLLTPKMLNFLCSLTEEDRQMLSTDLACRLRPVAISCFVQREETEQQIHTTLADLSCDWRRLDVGETRESLLECTIRLLTMLEDDQDSTPLPILSHCHLLPERPVKAGERVYILLDDTISHLDEQDVSIVSEDGRHLTPNKMAPNLYWFNAPDCESTTANITIIAKNDEVIGQDTIQYRDKMSELSAVLLDVINPVEFLAQSLRLSDGTSHVVDAELVRLFQDRAFMEGQGKFGHNIKPHLRKDFIPGGSSHKNQELPSLLHMCAKYNLPRFSKLLLDQPWSNMALELTNKDGHTPEQLAQSYCHFALAEVFASPLRDSGAGKSTDEIYITPDSELDYCSDFGSDSEIVYAEADEVPLYTQYVDMNHQRDRRSSTCLSTEPLPMAETKPRRSISTSSALYSNMPRLAPPIHDNGSGYINTTRRSKIKKYGVHEQPKPQQEILLTQQSMKKNVQFESEQNSNRKLKSKAFDSTEVNVVNKVNKFLLRRDKKRQPFRKSRSISLPSCLPLQEPTSSPTDGKPTDSGGRPTSEPVSIKAEPGSRFRKNSVPSNLVTSGANFEKDQTKHDTCEKNNVATFDPFLSPRISLPVSIFMDGSLKKLTPSVSALHTNDERNEFSTLKQTYQKCSKNETENETEGPRIDMKRNASRESYNSQEDMNYDPINLYFQDSTNNGKEKYASSDSLSLNQDEASIYEEVDDHFKAHTTGQYLTFESPYLDTLRLTSKSTPDLSCQGPKPVVDRRGSVSTMSASATDSRFVNSSVSPLSLPFSSCNETPMAGSTAEVPSPLSSSRLIQSLQIVPFKSFHVPSVPTLIRGGHRNSRNYTTKV